MYIIEAIPLASLPPQVPQLLSYYHNKALLKGSVIEILIGNRKVSAVVVSSSSLEDQKILLKSSSFQLKKISSVIDEKSSVSDIQFKIAIWLSKNYYASLGLSLKTVLPPFFLKDNYELKNINSGSKSNYGSVGHKPLVLISRAKSIIKNIEPEIKKIINQKKQVIIIVPEISVAKYFYDYFAGYYETSLVHSKLPVKKLYKNWQDISLGNAEIIIGTRQALFTVFHNPGLIIIEDPENEGYKSDMSPKYNTVELAKKISEIYSCPITFVSGVIGIDSYYNVKNGVAEIKNEPTIKTDGIKAVDMVQEIRSGNFSVFSRYFTEQMRESANKKILIFSSRKGFSGGLICENCGFGFKCPQCSVPLRLHKTLERFLVCHRCSLVKKFPPECPSCHSYKLKSIGFPGSQKIEEELRRVFMHISEKPEIFIIDSGVIKSPKAEEELIEKIESSKSCICIATQMIFSHRYDKKFDLIGLANADSLIAVPDFRSEEQLFYKFNKLLDFEPEKVIIQTYHIDNPIIKTLISGDYKDFYEKELQLRRLFWYPPFVRLAKLSLRYNDRQKAEYEARILGEKLKMAIAQRKLGEDVKMLGPSPAFVEKEKNLYVYNIILKVMLDKNPDEILRFVPSSWMIDIDPKSIL